MLLDQLLANPQLVALLADRLRSEALDCQDHEHQRVIDHLQQWELEARQAIDRGERERQALQKMLTELASQVARLNEIDDTFHGGAATGKDASGRRPVLRIIRGGGHPTIIAFDAGVVTESIARLRGRAGLRPRLVVMAVLVMLAAIGAMIGGLAAAPDSVAFNATLHPPAVRIHQLRRRVLRGTRGSLGTRHQSAAVVSSLRGAGGRGTATTITAGSAPGAANATAAVR